MVTMVDVVMKTTVINRLMIDVTLWHQQWLTQDNDLSIDVTVSPTQPEVSQFWFSLSVISIWSYRFSVYGICHYSNKPNLSDQSLVYIWRQLHIAKQEQRLFSD